MRRAPVWLLLYGLLLARPAGADIDADRARELVRRGEILPLETIIELVHRVHSGRLLEVELEYKHGRICYEIELLNDTGRVEKFFLDARSGALLDD